MAENQATEHCITGEWDDFEDDSDVVITAVVSPSRKFVFSNGFAELAQLILIEKETKRSENHRLSFLNKSKCLEPIIKSHSVAKPNENGKEPEMIVDLTDNGQESGDDGCGLRLSMPWNMNSEPDSRSCNPTQTSRHDECNAQSLYFENSPNEEHAEGLKDVHEVLIDMTPCRSECKEAAEVETFTADHRCNSGSVDFKTGKVCNKWERVEEEDVTLQHEEKKEVLQPVSGGHVDYGLGMKNDSKTISSCDCGERCRSSSGEGRCLNVKVNSLLSPYHSRRRPMRSGYDEDYTVHSRSCMDDKPVSESMHVGKKKMAHQPRARISRARRNIKHTFVKRIGEKYFKCKECGKRCTTTGGLKRHKMRIHGQKKDFKCHECGKSFKRCSDSIKHIETHIRGKQPFRCSECGKNFYDMQTLLMHREVHSGDKAFKCDECGKKFRHIQGLAVHRKVHNVYTAFKCKECGKGFSDIQYFTMHMRMHNEMSIEGLQL